MPELLGNDDEVERRGTRATEFRRERQAEEIHVGERLLQGVRRRGIVVPRLGDLGWARPGDEVADRAAEQLLFVGETEVHVVR